MPSLERLEAVLDAADAEHVYQAARNEVAYLITVDRRTMLSHADKALHLSGVRLVSP